MTNPDLTTPPPSPRSADPAFSTGLAVTYAAGRVEFAITTALRRARPQDDLMAALHRAADALHVAESLSRDAQ